MKMRGMNWHGFVRSPWAVLAVWALYCAARLAIQPLLGWSPVGPDDWTRLLEVRDWLGGQPFHDVTQYRMNPPEGFSMHWSRLVDLPLAGLTLLIGEVWAMALVPLLWLLPALFALRSIFLRLGLGSLAFAFGLVLLPLFPLLPGNFAPMRIDHHAPQAVLALVCGALLLRDTRRSAIASGLCAAAWVVISLEGLPLVAALAGLYAVRYWFGERMLLQWYLAALAMGAAVLTQTTRKLAVFDVGYCDVLLPGHLAAFIVAAVIAALIPVLPLQRDVRGRLGALALVPLFAMPVAATMLGPCLANPMAELDPVLLTYWHGFIGEGLPIWRQPFSMMLVLVWPLGLAAIGWWLAGTARMFDDGRALRWTLLAGYALAAALYSLLLMREGVVAQLLAIPFAAFLLGHYLPRARAIERPVPRILATLACFGLATPVFASAFAKPLDPVLTRQSLRADAMAMVEGEPCDYARLAQLDAALLFAPLDSGPEILGRTGHSVVAASYHRNQQPMRQVISALIGPVADAEASVRESGAEYVVSCSSEGDVALYRTAAPDNFANALASGEVPGWLESVEKFSEGSLRIYRVR